MPELGSTLKGALLALAITFAQAQTEAPSPEMLRAALQTQTGKARLGPLLALANSIESTRPQEALELAKEGMALAAQEGDRDKEAAFLSTASFCCSQTGDFSLGIEYGKRALVLGTALGDKDRMARAHNTLGITYAYLGVYSQALDEGIEALRLREEMGQEKAIGQSLNLLGVIYHHSGQYEKAIDIYDQILKRVDVKQDPRRLILTKHNIGFSLFKLGRFQEALKTHLEAMGLADETRETGHLPYAYLNLGMTYSELGQFEKARINLRKAEAAYRQQDQKHGLAQVMRSLVRMYLLSGDSSRGIPAAKEGVEMARHINSRDELKLGYELISEMYEKVGNLAESYRYYKLAVQTKDTLHSVAESYKLAEASMKIVTMKKDNEIEALKKEQRISALEMKSQRYASVVFIACTCFLVSTVVILGFYNKKMRQHRASLEQTNTELQEKIDEIRTLSGLLPICAHCKKIRDDEGYWMQLEGYISDRTEATFTHGICPHCAEDLYPEAMKEVRARREQSGPNPLV